MRTPVHLLKLVVHFDLMDPRLKLSHLHPRNYACLNGMRSGRPERQYSRHAVHSALWADFGNIRPFFRGRPAVRLMYRCPV